MGPRLKMSLFIILILITIYLFFSRIQFIQHRKAMDTKLSRVLKETYKRDYSQAMTTHYIISFFNKRANS